MVARQAALERAGGSVLAAALRMDIDSPPFDRAAVDGFAVQSGHARAGALLEIIGRQDAGGALFAGVVGPGQCVGINTGGRMPAGADGVLMVEHAVVEGDRMRVGKAVGAGHGMQRQGSDARAGQVVLEAGVRLGAAQLAVAATAGAAEVRVRRVRAAVLTTGDELVAAGERPGPGQIRNSNGPMIAELVREAGGEVLDLGVCGDDEARLRGLLERGLAEADLLVVSGGMSMGTRDLVPVLLKEMGVAIHVEKVRMKPGKPFLFGSVERAGERKYVAGLPGNPVSAFVTFHRFVRVAMGAMVGMGASQREIEARAGVELERNGDREFYQPCVFEHEGGQVVARPLSWKGSADLFTLARAQGLLVREAGAGPVAVGGAVRMLRL
jgi:molybdopterin molybdotransferase